MRSSEKHSPYSLYKKLTKAGLFWYVRYWNNEAKTYNIIRSTGIPVEGKRERWREADDAAKAILDELYRGKEKTSEAVSKELSIVNDQEVVVATAKQPKPGSVSDSSFVQYLLDFWTSDSEYANYKRDVKKRPLSAYYIMKRVKNLKCQLTSMLLYLKKNKSMPLVLRTTLVLAQLT